MFMIYFHFFFFFSDASVSSCLTSLAVLASASDSSRDQKRLAALDAILSFIKSSKSKDVSSLLKEVVVKLPVLLALLFNDSSQLVDTTLEILAQAAEVIQPSDTKLVDESGMTKYPLPAIKASHVVFILCPSEFHLLHRRRATR